MNAYNTKESFNAIVCEYFDLTDMKTVDSLVGLNEQEQNQVLASITAKLYKQIVDKVAHIDYGGIPASKGDIMMVPNMSQMIECVDTIKKLIQQYKDSPVSVNIVETAIINMQKMSKHFKSGFNVNSEIIKITYNNLALSIVSSVDLLLATCVDYTNSPTRETGAFEYVLDSKALTKSKDHLLLKNLKSFNDSCAKGDFESVMKQILGAQRKVDEGALALREFGVEAVIGGILATVATIKLLTLILPIIREVVYFFFATKQKLSDYFELQANIIQMNAERLKNSTTKTPEERQKIANKQIEIAKKFRSIANKLAVKYNTGQADANRDLDRDKPVMRANDVTDYKPGTGSGDLF